MADGLVDLKRSKAEVKKERTLATAEEKDYDYYPLTLYVSQDEVEKLGLANCKVGDEYDMDALVHVVSMSMSKDERGGGHTSVTLQIRKAKIDTGTEKSQADKLYG